MIKVSRCARAGALPASAAGGKTVCSKLFARFRNSFLGLRFFFFLDIAIGRGGGGLFIIAILLVNVNYILGELTLCNVFSDVTFLYLPDFVYLSPAHSPFHSLPYAKRLTYIGPIFLGKMRACVPWLRDLLEVYMAAKTRAASAGPATQSCLHCPGNQRRRSLQVGTQRQFFLSLDTALRVALETRSYFRSSSVTPSSRALLFGQIDRKEE